MANDIIVMNININVILFLNFSENRKYKNIGYTKNIPIYLKNTVNIILNGFSNSCPEDAINEVKINKPDNIVIVANEDMNIFNLNLLSIFIESNIFFLDKNTSKTKIEIINQINNKSL